MDEEDSQNELINRNTSHGKGKRAATWAISDEDSDDDGEGAESEGEEEGDSDSGEEEEEEGDHIEGEEDEDDEEDEDEETDDGEEEEEEEDAGKAAGGAVGGTSADLADLSSDEDSEKCPICLNSFHSQPVATPESCEHYFCLDCILEWSKNANSCPVDRIVFNHIYLRKSYGGKVQKMMTVQKPVKEGQDEVAVDLTLEQTTCEVCQGSDHEDRLLLCDGCDAGYHMECLTPPLNAVPVEEWFCPGCEANNRHSRSSGEDLSEAESVHSARATTSRPRPATAGPTRAIARTQQSERVRANVNRHRITQARTAEFAPRFLMQSTWLDDTINAVVAGLNTAVYIRDLTPRATTSRRRKTVRRRKGVSKKSSASGGKGKAAGTGVKRRKRRKVRRKKSRKRTAVKKTPTSRGRIARSLGISKPKRGSTLPSLYRPTETTLGSMRSDIGAASLSVYGDPFGLDGFDNGDEEEEQDQVTSLLDAKRRGLSRSALRSHQPVARPITAGVSRRGGAGLPPVEEVVEAAPVPDLLGSILSGQSMLLMDSADVVINRDGTLKALKPVSLSSSRPGSSMTSSPGDPGPQVTPGMSPNPGVSPLSLHSNGDPAGPSPGPCLSPLTPSSPGPTNQSHHQPPPYSHPPTLGPPPLHPHAPHRPNPLPGHSHRGTNGVGPPHGSHRGATSTSVPTPDSRSRGRETALPQPQAKKAAPKPVWAGDVSVLPRIPKLKRESSEGLTNGSTSRGGSTGSGSGSGSSSSSGGGSGNASGRSKASGSSKANASGSSKANASGSRDASTSGSSKANASGSSNASGSRNSSVSGSRNASASSNANATHSGNTNANGGSNGLPGPGMHSLAGNRGKQQGVDQQQGRNQTRPRPDRAAPPPSAFSNSFSSSSASSAASSSSSFSTVCFRINSSGNAWLAHNNALETVSEATEQEAAAAAEKEKLAKLAKKRVAHVSKAHTQVAHTPQNSHSHTQVKEEEVEEEIYDPFNPTGSDSNGSDSEAEGQATEVNSQNATAAAAVGGKRPGRQVKAETLESRISLARCEGGKRVAVKKEPEHTVVVGSERPGHGPKPAPMSGMTITAATPLPPHSLVPVKIERKDPGEEEEENGAPTSLQKRATVPTPSASASASSHHSERRVKTEIKSEPNDSPPRRTTKSRSKSPSRSSGQGRKASKGNSGGGSGGSGGGQLSKERRSISSSPEAGRRRGGVDQDRSSSSQGRRGRGEEEGRERERERTQSKRSRSRERRQTPSTSDSSLSESSDRRKRRSHSRSKDRRRSRSGSRSSSREPSKRRRRGDERRGGSRERNDSARGNERERERGRVSKDKRHGGRSRSRSRSRSRDRRKEKEDRSRSQHPPSSSSGSKVRVEPGSKDRKRSRSRERRKDEGPSQKTTQKTTTGSSKEPKELSSKEPKELSSKEPKELSSKEPKELSSKEPKELSSKEPKELSSKEPKELKEKKKEKALPQGSLKEKREVRPVIKQEIPAFVSGLKPVETGSDVKKEINCVDIGTDSDVSARLVKEEVLKVIKKEKLPSFDMFMESPDTNPIKKEKAQTPSLSVVKDFPEPKEIKKEKRCPPLKNEAFLLSLEERCRKEQVPLENPVKIKSEPIWPELPQHLPPNVPPPPSTAPSQPSPVIPSPSPGPLPQPAVTADSLQGATSSLPPPESSDTQTETSTQTSVQFEPTIIVKEEAEDQPLDSDEDFNDVDMMLDCLDFVKSEKSEKSEEGDPGGGGGGGGEEGGVVQEEVEGEQVKTEGEPVPVTAGAGAKTKPSVKRVTWNLEEPEDPPVEKTASKLALYKLKLKQEGARRPASSTQLANQAASSDTLPPAGLSHPGQVEDSEEGGVEPLRNNIFMKKLHMQERAIEEVKLAIKPFYQKRDITKDEYKEIVRKAVQKVCHSKSGEINPVKVANLVKAYVDRYKHSRKHRREEDEGKSQEETENEGTGDPETP